jgi:hypothetical protein
MDEALILRTYNEGINAVVTLVKDLGKDLELSGMSCKA